MKEVQSGFERGLKGVLCLRNIAGNVGEMGKVQVVVHLDRVCNATYNGLPSSNVIVNLPLRHNF